MSLKFSGVSGELGGSQNHKTRPKTQTFADSPLLLEIQAFEGRRKPQKTTDFRRKPKILAENRRNPRLGSVTIPCVAKWLQTDINYLRINYGVTDTELYDFRIDFRVTDTDLALLIP